MRGERWNHPANLPWIGCAPLKCRRGTSGNFFSPRKRGLSPNIFCDLRTGIKAHDFPPEEHCLQILLVYRVIGACETPGYNRDERDQPGGGIRKVISKRAVNKPIDASSALATATRHLFPMRDNCSFYLYLNLEFTYIAPNNICNSAPFTIYKRTRFP